METVLMKNKSINKGAKSPKKFDAIDNENDINIPSYIVEEELFDTFLKIVNIQKELKNIASHLHKFADPKEYQRYENFKIDFKNIRQKYGGNYIEFEKKCQIEEDESFDF